MRLNKCDGRVISGGLCKRALLNGFAVRASQDSAVSILRNRMFVGMTSINLTKTPQLFFVNGYRLC